VSTDRSRRNWQSLVVKSLRRAVIVFVLLLLIEYLVVPELVGASKDLYLLGRVNAAWLVLGLGLEAASLFCYGLLTRALLPGQQRPSLFVLFRIDLAAAAVAHVVPAGTLGSAGIGYRLFTSAGIDGNDAAVMMASKGLGSTVVLNVLLWLSLVISIPLAGFHPIYVTVAILGAVTLLAVAGLTFGIIHGAPRASRILRAVGARIPRVGPDKLEQAFLKAADSLSALGRDRTVVTASLAWASANWLLDAASLWCFVGAFGSFVNPVELFAAYGIANVAGVLPITPAGLGVVDSVAPLLLISFGVTRSVATLGVLSWRLVNFWLPIPTGALAYVSLQAPGRWQRAGMRRALSDLAARVGAAAAFGSARVEAPEGDLGEQHPDGRGHRDRDKGADDAEQDAADQHGDEADHGGHLDGAAHDPGDDQVILGQPIPDVEAQGADGHRQRDREGDQCDHGPADG
jgi:hypothetical protein